MILLHLLSNPLFFEDPRTVTEARFVFVHHRLPPALGNGEVQVYAVQLRAALSDRLSIIANKDGFIIGQQGAPLNDGWADVALGLKYLLWSDPQAGRLLSGGVTFDVPIGSTQALQGNGDGEFNLFLTGGARIGCDWHWVSATGLRLPSDAGDESRVWYWSNHLDRHLGGGWYWVGEINWYHWMGSGDQVALAGIEGLDMFNFGSTGVSGNDIVTGAVGFKYSPHSKLEIGLVWETPLTVRRDILENRITMDCILRY